MATQPFYRTAMIEIRSMRIFSTILPLALTGGLAACSLMPDMEEVLPDRKVEYKKQREAGENLEIPPDLTTSSINDALVIPDAASGMGSATYSEYVDQRSGGRRVATQGDVLPKVEKVAVRRDGDDRWLEVEAPPQAVWPQVVAFWRQQGILLVQQDPATGVMTTDWIENRANIKQDFIRTALSKVVDGLYSSGTRDQYRVRLEPGIQDGTTDLYLTHRGMEEKLVTDAGGNVHNTFWEPRPSDPGLEAEMLRRLMNYLGIADRKAQRQLAEREQPEPSRSQLTTGRGGSASLVINEDFPRAWRLTGTALDRVGFAVEDWDRAQGVYFVRYDDPFKDVKSEKGVLSKLAFWKSDEPVDSTELYQVRLSREGETKTTAVVLNEQGARDSSVTATRILTLLHEQIR